MALDLWTSAAETAKAVAAGETSALSVVEAALTRVDARNPQLNAFTAVTRERAVAKAGERARGAAAASDAFFPFRDGLDQLADAGVVAVVEPGGSRRDEEVIAAAEERGGSLLFTGRRHFRH